MKKVDFSVSYWMECSGPENDIVISSRVRVARNLAGQVFSCLASNEQTKAVLDKVYSVIENQKELSDFNLFTMKNLSILEKQALVEKHLISPMLARNSQNGALLLSGDEATGLMINEEDHLRLQVILPGLQLEEAWKKADYYDSLIEQELDYAFDEQCGYLTACPTNVGTGLRGSVMLHLPALIMTGQLNRLLAALSQVGLAVRGLYGEGSEITGNLVQISNQVTLGQSEEEIIGNLGSMIGQVMEQEQNARQALLDKKRAQMADRAWRALGLLRYAQVMSSKEAIQLISDLRLGHDLGLVKSVDHRLLNLLLVLIRPACLQILAGRELSNEERNLERPVQIKKALDI